MGKALVVDSANQGSIARGEPTTIVVAGGVPYFVDSANNITALGLASSFANNITAGSPDITISGLATDGSPDLNADYIRTYDAGAGTTKKVLLGVVGAGVAATPQNTTSGTSINFTGIPEWVTSIEIMFVKVSTSGTSPVVIRLGDSGGAETDDYAGVGIAGSSTIATGNFSNGFGLGSGTWAGTLVISGKVSLTLENSSLNTWSAFGFVARTETPAFLGTIGTKSLSARLDRVVITTSGGTDTFDGGQINIRYR